MFAAIFGVLAGVAHEAAKAVEEVGERAGIPKWITGGISGAFTAVGNVSDSAKEIEVPGLGNPLAMMGDTVKSFMGGFTTDEALPAVGPKFGRTAEDAKIVAAMATQPKPPNYWSLGDIGQLPAQFTNVAKERPLDIGQGTFV